MNEPEATGTLDPEIREALESKIRESRLRKKLASVESKKRARRTKPRARPDGVRYFGKRIMVWKRKGAEIEIEIGAVPGKSKARFFRLTVDSAAFARTISKGLENEAPWVGEDPIQFFRRVVKMKEAAFRQAARRMGR